MAELAVRSSNVQDLMHKLVGKHFSNAAELRALIRAAGVVEEVSVEIVSATGRVAAAGVRSEKVGKLVLRAERSVPWHPYRVAEVEAA